MEGREGNAETVKRSVFNIDRRQRRGRGRGRGRERKVRRGHACRRMQDHMTHELYIKYRL